RDHVPGPAQHDGITDTHVLAPDLVFIVQGRMPYHHAAHLHRLQPSDRRDDARAPDRGLDVEHDADRLARGKLIGDGPARRPRGEAQALLASQLIYLVDHPVDLEWQLFTPRHEAMIVSQAFLRAMHD